MSHFATTNITDCDYCQDQIFRRIINAGEDLQGIELILSKVHRLENRFRLESFAALRMTIARSARVYCHRSGMKENIRVPMRFSDLRFEIN